MKHLSNRVGAVACGVMLAAAGAAQADIVSTFDTNTEGWTLINGADSLTWNATLGNPGGGISGNEGASNRIWYYVAPAAFLGDQSVMSGGSITWDIRNIGGGTPAGETADVILDGAGIRIGYPIPGNIDLPAWQTFSVPLSPTGWFHMDSFPTPSLLGPVTESEFAAVLANVTAMYVQGEYRNGNDTSALDNVIMAPAPTICPECAADYDDNGGIDGADLSAFFFDYEAGAGCADVDQNGGIDGADLAHFFTTYEAGGC